MRWIGLSGHAGSLEYVVEIYLVKCDDLHKDPPNQVKPDA
jgi:hypothetical protein